MGRSVRGRGAPEAWNGVMLPAEGERCWGVVGDEYAGEKGGVAEKREMGEDGGRMVVVVR